jgi:diguanylate cyclase (GGDEF)-like protein
MPACWPLPITGRTGATLGAIALHRDPAAVLADEEQIALQVAADLSAVAIEKNQIRAALEYRATHDPLTGLLNRDMLVARIEQAIAVSRRDQAGWAVLVIDLDGFKEINDTLGHQVGDSLLRQAGARLARQLAPADALVRMGGDEFAVVLASVPPDGGATSLAHRLLACLQEPFDVEQAQVRISASIGVARGPRDGSDAAALLRHADIAMFKAKRESSGVALFEHAEGERMAHKAHLMADLRSAITRCEFELYYQPKIALSRGETIGFEALARWRHPARGMISPAEFIPMIEVSDLIHPFSSWAIEAALTQCAAWHAGGAQAGVAVNISARNLLDIGLPERIETSLRQHRLAPRWLTLEITESSIMADPGRALDVLTRLHRIGVRIAIDDFGTGYSSLAYLQKLPVDSLKIDQTFVRQMIDDRDGLAIVSSIIDLAHALGLVVVAEGIETEDTLARLRALRCDAAQGYFIARPMPAHETLDWLLARPVTL